MYSPLHERIGKLLSSRRYAIASCRAKKIYLKGYKVSLAVDIVDEFSKHAISSELKQRVKNLSTYHHSYVKKVEKRELNTSEIDYMCSFYLGLESFINQKGITLILIHNDLRWYHAIAIDICKKNNIPYLVTEQGLIRPYTTVIDNKGVNANANINLFDKNDLIKSDFTPKSKHDSYISMFFFAIFISIFSIDRLNENKSILRYMHNNYSLRKYSIRLLNKFKIGKKNQEPYNDNYPKKSLLFLMQLETDSQILVHSEFNNNQEIIKKLEKCALALNKILVIKKHPLDFNHYNVSNNTFWVGGAVQSLAKKSEIVITVNSSAALDVIKTSTPLILLGDSIYNRQGVAVRTDFENLIEIIPGIEVSEKARKKFINSISDNYLVPGAGFSYDDDVLSLKLKGLLS
jgi:capsular polysaccharide export protein